MDVINLISKPDGLPDEPVDKPGDIAFPLSSVNGPRVHQYLHEMNRKVLSRQFGSFFSYVCPELTPCASWILRLRYYHCWRMSVDS